MTKLLDTNGGPTLLANCMKFLSGKRQTLGSTTWSMMCRTPLVVGTSCGWKGWMKGTGNVPSLSFKKGNATHSCPQFFYTNQPNYFASSDPHHGIQFIPSDILSGKSSGILFGILFEILSGISSGILSVISSDILSDISLWHSIWHIFWHPIWHSIWNIFWHSIWNIFWHSIRHIFWHSIWPSIWHSLWHSIWLCFWPLRSG